MAGRNEQRKVLVVGALGLVGRAVVEALEDQDGCELVAVSRRQPSFPTQARFLQLDLTDRTACQQQLSRLDGITHIVYAALYEKPDLIAGWRDHEQVETNTRMLANVLEFVTPTRHLTLLQGTKA
ncbi:MAG: NAD-dependent epimerase/dehydratase family protein [Gammaproteobacteria bacterium]|nr:NAD-dependent epimerase/dehydratase family protein [Gammaproteobacteria bacterium]